MPLGAVAKQTLIDLAVAGARAALREITDPNTKAALLDETAERLKFDAEGERKLAKSKARRGR